MMMSNDQHATTIATAGGVVIITAVIASKLLKKVKSKKSPSGVPSPPIVTSYVPFFGPIKALIDMGLGGFAKKYSKELNDAPMITAKIGGKTMHLIADPAAFPAIFRYGIKDLSMGPAIADFSKSFFGMSKQGLAIFDTNARKQNNESLHNHFLKPQGLQEINNSAQSFIVQQMETMLSEKSINDNDESSSSSFELYEFVRNTIFKATLSVAISESESIVDDEFIALFECFDKAIPKAFAGLPIRFVAPESYKAREKLINILQSDSFVPSSYLKERRQFLTSLGMNPNDIARDNLLWVWGSGTNFVPSQFWHIYFLVSNPKAMQEIRQEVDNVIARRKSPPSDFDGIFTMEEFNSMIGLGSAFQESNRLTMTNRVAREVMHDMDIDLRLSKNKNGNSSKYFIEEGSSILLYPPLLHHDPYVFENPQKYQWNRFMPTIDPTTSKPVSPVFKSKSGEVITDPFRGFGGGAHYCPGRKLATNIAKSFAANLIYRYDMELVSPQPAQPSELYDYARDAFGVYHPNSKVDISFTPRHK